MISKQQECFNLVLDFFKGDEIKTNYWFKTYNPLLGATPSILIERGRIDKLLKWIEVQIEENISTGPNPE